MVEAGILQEDDPVELIEGRIVTTSPASSRHAEIVRRLSDLFYDHASRARVSIQNPIRIGRHSEPEPDVALIERKDYSARHPRPKEVLLLIKVSIASKDFDLERKVPLYARAGIREVWVVTPEDEQIHVFRGPAGGGYDEHATRQRGEEIPLLALPDVTVAVSDVLGG